VGVCWPKRGVPRDRSHQGFSISGSAQRLRAVQRLARARPDFRVSEDWQSPVRVVIADDHPVVRDGLAVMFDMLPDIVVVGQAATGEEAVEVVAMHRPDVVLMDLRMPKLGGVEAIRRIRGRYPTTQIVVLTTYADDSEIRDAFRAGAVSYLTKDADRKEIYRALTAAATGKGPVPPEMSEQLIAAESRKMQPVDAAGQPKNPDGLTQRECDVLRLIGAGRSNREIVTTLHVSEATIKTHINRVFAKTRVRNRAQAVRYAFRHGLASYDDP